MKEGTSGEEKGSLSRQRAQQCEGEELRADSGSRVSLVEEELGVRETRGSGV